MDHVFHPVSYFHRQGHTRSVLTLLLVLLMAVITAVAPIHSAVANGAPEPPQNVRAYGIFDGLRVDWDAATGAEEYRFAVVPKGSAAPAAGQFSSTGTDRTASITPLDYGTDLDVYVEARHGTDWVAADKVTATAGVSMRIVARAAGTTDLLETPRIDNDVFVEAVYPGILTGGDFDLWACPDTSVIPRDNQAENGDCVGPNIQSQFGQNSITFTLGQAQYGKFCNWLIILHDYASGAHSNWIGPLMGPDGDPLPGCTRALAAPPGAPPAPPQPPATPTPGPSPVTAANGTIPQPLVGTTDGLLSGLPVSIAVGVKGLPLPGPNNGAAGGTGSAQTTGVTLVPSTPDLPPFEILLAPAAPNGGPGSGGVIGSSLVLRQGEGVATRMEGFAPFTPARLWMMSEPKLLGEFVVDANGALDAIVSLLPADISACRHTIQVVGVLPDGQQLAASLGVWVAANPFPFADITATSTHGPAVGCLESLGAVRGFGDRVFNSNTPLTRGQAASIITELFNLPPANLADTDVAPHAASLAAVIAAGIMEPGPDGHINPYARVTRAEAALLLARVLQLSDQDPTFGDVNGHRARGAIGALERAGLVAGVSSGRFLPDQPVTRGQFASMAVQTYYHQSE